jgi:hypothetical protein
MSIYHNVVSSEDEVSDFPLHSYHDLEGFPIHQIWQPERFRFTSLFEQVPLPELDTAEHDFPTELYDRMVPGLRLATLILEKILPDLARIRFGEFETMTSTGNIEDRVLTSRHIVPESETSLMRQELNEMCDYRIGFLPDPDSDGATTYKVEINPSDKAVYVQSAIGISWLKYLSSPDWNDDTQHLYDRNGRYVVLACLLIHELAHAVWCQRMLPLAKDEVARTGKISINFPEPKFTSSDIYREVGYAVELQIFRAIMWATNEKEEDFGDIQWFTCEKEKKGVVGISFITASGKTNGRHKVTPQSVGALFDPSLWTRDETGKFPPLTLHILPNLLKPGEELPTLLSEPPPPLKFPGN